MPPAKYTLRDGDRKFKRIFWSTALPGCQHPFLPGGSPCRDAGEFDAPTIHGPWADLCDKHLLQHTRPGTQIGYHRVRQV